MTILAIADKFDARGTGRGRFMAKCPAHKDRSPSLSIREGKDGRVLVRCFAGCALDAVLDARGLRTADPISRETVKSNLDAMSEALTSLGELSFGWPKSREPKRSGSNRTKLYQSLDMFPAGSVNEDDVFLFYYFGHGFLKGENLCS
jgi:hypothetical protein